MNALCFKTHGDLDELAMLWSRKLQPVIDRVVPLEDGKEACRAMTTGEHFGKKSC